MGKGQAAWGLSLVRAGVLDATATLAGAFLGAAWAMALAATGLATAFFTGAHVLLVKVDPINIQKA